MFRNPQSMEKGNHIEKLFCLVLEMNISLFFLFIYLFRTGQYVLNKIFPACICWCMKGCNTGLSGMS